MCTARVNKGAVKSFLSGRIGKTGLILMHVKNLTRMLLFSAFTVLYIDGLFIYLFLSDLLYVGTNQSHDTWLNTGL